MTLPIIESLGGRLVLYFAVSAAVSVTLMKALVGLDFSINVSSRFQAGRETREWYIMPRLMCG